MALKILYLTSYYKPAFVYGGPVISTADTCEALVRAGLDITVFTTNANGSHTLDVELNREQIVDGVRVWYFPLWFKGLGAFFSPPMEKKIKSEFAKFDIVVADVMYGYSSIFLSSYSKQFHTKYIISALGQLMPWALNYKRLKKSIYFRLFGNSFLNNASAIRCTSKFEQTSIGKLGVKVPTFVVPHGINLKVSQYKQTGGTFRRLFGIPMNKNLILVLGRLHKVKQPEVALNAFLLLNDDNSHLVFVGPDEQNYVPYLQGLAKKANRLDQVHFTGVVSHDYLSIIFSDSDLIISPSLQENFGIAIVEGMASGMPAVISKNIPIGELIEEWNAGKCVDANAASFAIEIGRLLSDKQALRVAGRRAKQLVSAKFNIDVEVKELIKKYYEISEVKNGTFKNYLEDREHY